MTKYLGPSFADVECLEEGGSLQVWDECEDELSGEPFNDVGVLPVGQHIFTVCEIERGMVIKRKRIM